MMLRFVNLIIIDMDQKASAITLIHQVSFSTLLGTSIKQEKDELVGDL